MNQTFTRLLLVLSSVLPLVAGAQLSNDDCGRPLTLIMSPTTTPTFTSVTTVGATASTPAPSCTATSANDDVWFSFIATSTKVVVSYNSFFSSGGPSSGLGFTLHSACPVNNLPTDPLNLFCTFSFGTAAAGGSITATTANLVVGQTYFIRLFAQGSTSSASFNVGLASPPIPPVNDNCATATPFTVSGAAAACTFVTVNTAGATQSTPPPTCTGASNDDDVWFSFVAPSANLLLRYQGYTLSGAASSGLGYSIVSACGGMDIVCDFTFGNASTGFQYVDPATPFVIGQTYYIRLFAQGAPNSASFQFCMQEVDVPEIAVPPSNACVTTTVTLTGLGGDVPALDADGRVIAFIENTQALGLTTVSLYGNTGALRTFAGTRPYLDRNVTITPSLQPTGPVTVGIPVPFGEINTLYTANGSQTFADYQFVKRDGTSCSPTFDGSATPQPFSGIFFYPGGYRFETSVASFSEFFMVPANAPLPVELTRFTARTDGSRNMIEWAAASEHDLATYTVERADGADFTRFAAVASVAPRGTSTGVEAIYTAYDDAPARVSYYRLKAVDLDGSVDYSDVVAVTRTAGAPGIKVYPNPSRAGASASIALAGVDEVAGVNVTISDAAGRQVGQVRYTTDGNYVLPVGGLPAGMYTISAVTAVGVHTERLVIE